MRHCVVDTTIFIFIYFIVRAFHCSALFSPPLRFWCGRCGGCLLTWLCRRGLNGCDDTRSRPYAVVRAEGERSTLDCFPVDVRVPLNLQPKSSEFMCYTAPFHSTENNNEKYSISKAFPISFLLASFIHSPSFFVLLPLPFPTSYVLRSLFARLSARNRCLSATRRNICA